MCVVKRPQVPEDKCLILLLSSGQFSLLTNLYRMFEHNVAKLIDII